jgi:hypothetical protein
MNREQVPAQPLRIEFRIGTYRTEGLAPAVVQLGNPLEPRFRDNALLHYDVTRYLRGLGASC